MRRTFDRLIQDSAASSGSAFMKRPLVIAHRGSSGHATENTLQAIRLAIDEGSDGIEVDVRACADGIPVLSHDPTIPLASSPSAPIASLDIQSLRTLTESSAHPIPSLSDALDLVSGKCRLYLDIKEFNALPGVLSLLDEQSARRVSLFASDARILLGARSARPRIECGLNVHALDPDPLESAMQLEIDLLVVRSDLIGESWIRLAGREGIRVYAWTVNEREEFRRLVRCGVDAVITDYPDLMLRERDQSLSDRSPS